MIKKLSIIVMAAALMTPLSSRALLAQTPQTSAPAAPTSGPPAAGTIPLQVQVVVSRFQGEKKISSVPYAMAVNAGEMVGLGPGAPRPSQLRVGAEVTVPTLTGTPARVAIGTNIDCRALALGNGRFQVNLTIEDSSLFVNGQAVQALPQGDDIPIARSFRFANELTLRDGQSIQFVAATDRIIGEVVKVDVTINTVK